MRHRHADRHHPLRRHARAVRARPGGHRPAVLRRPDLLRRRRPARRPRRTAPSSRAASTTCSWTSSRTSTAPSSPSSTCSPGRIAQLFVVGDDDQLIYGWRQADPRGILEFHRRVPPKPWSATYTLCTNYRCSRAVVETGARLVANNVVREAKEHPPSRGRAGRRGALRRRAGVAGARPGDLRLPARREVAPRLRLARPGRALPLPLAAVARRARAGRRRGPADAGARLPPVHAPGGATAARLPGPGARARRARPPRSSPGCSTGRTAT